MVIEIVAVDICRNLVLQLGVHNVLLQKQYFVYSAYSTVTRNATKAAVRGIVLRIQFNVVHLASRELTSTLSDVDSLSPSALPAISLTLLLIGNIQMSV